MNTLRRLSPWGVISAGIFVFLWAPLCVVAVYSFNAARFGAGWRGFTFEWYAALRHNEAALAALRTTLLLATFSTAISTCLGTLLGYGLGRFRVPGRRGIHILMQIPILVPDVVFAVSLVLLFSILNRWIALFEPGLGTMVLGHASFQIPFVALVVRARTAALDRTHEEAARDLGATPSQVFRHVTLPLLLPGIVAGALLAFTLSLDDFAVSFFTSGPGSTTLPILIYASARRGITPDINALSTLLIVGTLLAVVATRQVVTRWRSPGMEGG